LLVGKNGKKLVNKNQAKEQKQSVNKAPTHRSKNVTEDTGSAFAISEGGRSKRLTRGESSVLGFE
jgi:hypothetical protein